MTPEDRAAKKALLSLARWAGRRWKSFGKKSVDPKYGVQIQSEFACYAIEACNIAREVESRARRIK